MKKTTGFIATALASTVAAASLATLAAPAQAAEGTTSLAEVLKADGTKFDKSWKDYDIVEAAVYAVLDANPKSSVAVLADGNTALTAFIPNDAAFRQLARQLGAMKKQAKTEAATFKFLAGKLGVKTIENVLLYHVVPGSTITSADAVKADGAKLDTALAGAQLGVRVSGGNVFCVDLDTNAPDAKVTVVDLNKGNLQVAHGINKVLRPVDL